MSAVKPFSAWQLILLRAMQDQPLYMGTVPHKDKLARRAKNKRARRARAITRGDAR